ncbi:MAG TPA: hypothetical protein VMD97_10735 [Candidatus Aquilonibacter sp.]|nr:hypothetical protein [Candidatus Aquilonibacter sp.]
MSLMDAPAYDPHRDERNRKLLITVGAVILGLFIIFFAGYVAGHGWFFSNLPAEHKVNNFFNALEAKDYQKAYNIYENGHPDPSYPLSRFTEDWTKYSPVNAPITSHHVDLSKTDGSGFFGTGIIVAVRVNLQDGIVPVAAGEEPNTKPGHKVFMYVNRADGTLEWPAPHILEYH